ncbi:MAG: lamin tail domain-containing protein [Deltaproteobacteria bacterium]|nr:lamin tail domain-containing protein [Deltaproteobacteria bacterium]
MRASLLLLALAACQPSDPSAHLDRDGDGFTPAQGDCDDHDASAFPGGVEVWYDGVDQDCDGNDDDQDLDGYGLSEDCDDEDPAVNPGAREVCNGVDDDCDLSTDGADAHGASPWYPDLDGDGYGDTSAMVRACEAPEGCIARSGDCDDSDPETRPYADEWCNGVDDDCDGEVDEPRSVDASMWYLDADGDGYGTEDAWFWGCPPASGYVSTYGDCDDSDPETLPGAAEVLDLRDQDCDGFVDEDFLAAGDLVVTEIMHFPTLAGLCSCSLHDADWFEIWNGRDTAVCLDNWTLTDELGHGFQIASEAAVVVEPDGYVVLCNRDTFFGDPARCDYEWSDLTREPGYYDVDFVLDVVDGLVSLAAGDRVVDVVDWESYAVPDSEGNHWPTRSAHSMQLDARLYDATSNDRAGAWCAASEDFPFGDEDLEYYPNYGTPRADNVECP